VPPGSLRIAIVPPVNRMTIIARTVPGCRGGITATEDYLPGADGGPAVGFGQKTKRNVLEDKYVFA